MLTLYMITKSIYKGNANGQPHRANPWVFSLYGYRPTQPKNAGTAFNMHQTWYPTNTG